VDATLAVIFTVLGIFDSIPQFDIISNHIAYSFANNAHPGGASRNRGMVLHRQPVLGWNNIPCRCCLVIAEETMTANALNALIYSAFQI
jgi:hypothetical protein